MIQQCEDLVPVEPSTAIEAADGPAGAEGRREGRCHPPKVVRGDRVVAMSSRRRSPDVVLREEDRAAYQALLNRPETTGEEARAWLRSRGYAVGYKAGPRRRADLAGSLKGLRNAARFADALGKLAERQTPPALAGVTLARVQQAVMHGVFEAFCSNEAGDEDQDRLADAEALGELAKVVLLAAKDAKLPEGAAADSGETRGAALVESPA